MKTFPVPSPGDIVWCRFPQVEGIHPGPKPRPALILAVDEQAAPIRVRVAYGTSRGIHDLATWEFRIGPEDGAAFGASGLSLPTKFSMRQVVVLDYTELWFSIAPGQPARATPRLGVLHPALVSRARLAFEAAAGPLAVRERLDAVYAIENSHLDDVLQVIQFLTARGQGKRNRLGRS